MTKLRKIKLKILICSTDLKFTKKNVEFGLGVWYGFTIYKPINFVYLRAAFLFRNLFNSTFGIIIINCVKFAVLAKFS